MRDIKDYLHLYIGCQVSREHAGSRDKRFFEHAKLVGVSASETEPGKTVAILDVGLDHFHEWYAEETKLNLRQLLSMTEEEMVEFVHRKNRSILTNIDRTTITKIGWAYKDSSNGIAFSYFKKVGSGASSGGHTYHINESDPDQFQYLLSKGFDLFGLIESGLAIDSTKMEKVS